MGSSAPRRSACGCVPLVSDACTEFCRHMDNALIHSAGDVNALAEHFTMLHEDRALLERLRKGALATAPEATWDRAGEVLVEDYHRAVDLGPATAGDGGRRRQESRALQTHEADPPSG